MTSNFLKGFNLKSKHFFDSYVPLKPKTYCIVIVYDNGHTYEKHGIERPWSYINKLKKNPRIKTAYIKDENNM